MTFIKKKKKKNSSKLKRGQYIPAYVRIRHFCSNYRILFSASSRVVSVSEVTMKTHSHTKRMKFHLYRPLLSDRRTEKEAMPKVAPKPIRVVFVVWTFFLSRSKNQKIQFFLLLTHSDFYIQICILTLYN